MSKDKTFKTFRFPVSKDPQKIDREIQDWAEKNGMTEVERSSYTAFQLEGKNYLICVSEFEMTEEDEGCDLTQEDEGFNPTQEELDAMFDFD